MNRRGFLQLLIASPILLKTVQVQAVDTLFKIDTENTSFAVGYDNKSEFTWLRVSVILPDGREWHDIVQKSGGDFTGDNKAMEIMWKTHEIVLQRHLTKS